MSKSVSKLKSVHLAPSSPMKLFVWKIRRGIRNKLGGRDLLATTPTKKRPAHTKVREMYVKFDQFMVKLMPQIERAPTKEVAMARIRDALEHELGYRFFDIDEKRPWGAYFRIVDEQLDTFLAEFFPGLSATEARLGRSGVGLSPKIMVVCPGQRLSWQYHEKRTERWRFLTPGIYYRSHSDEQGRPHKAAIDDIVQFGNGERHRLSAEKTGYTIVAEIWQHTEPGHPSDESDIIRLADDYQR